MKLKSFLIIGCSLLGLSSCSDMIYDDLADCPTGVRINMTGIPLTLTPTAGGTPYNSKSQYDYIKDATFFVYNQDNQLVHYYNAGTDLLDNNYQVLVPTEAGKYTIYCWTGGSSNGFNYNFDGIVAGQSSKSDFNCYYNADALDTYELLAPMGYGKVADVTVLDHAITDVDMDVISNKKTLSCVFRYVQNETAADGTTTTTDCNMADYTFYIQSDNRWYNMENEIVPYANLKYHNISPATVSIIPDTDENGNAVSITLNSVALNTLRLMDGDTSTRFVVLDNEGNTVCNLPIVSYLSLFAAAKNAAGMTNSMSVQDYLDYTDEYNIIFNVTKDKTTEVVNNARFRISSIEIAGWIYNIVNLDSELQDLQNK